MDLKSVQFAENPSIVQLPGSIISQIGAREDYFLDRAISPLLQEIPRKAGRPSKKPSSVMPRYAGIVRAPVTEGNLLEFVFQEPYIFKNLSTMVRHMSKNEIEFVFAPESMSACVVHRDKESVLFFNILVDRAVSYYCKREFSVGIKRTRLEEVFQSNGRRNTPPVLFESREDEHKSILYVKSQDAEYKTSDVLPMEVITTAEQDPHMTQEPNWHEYALIIQIPSDRFKQFVNCTRASEIMLNFSRNDDGNIVVSLCEGLSILRQKIFVDDETIRLVANSDIAELCTSIYVTSAKPFIGTRLSDVITIAIDPHEYVMMMYETELFSVRQYYRVAQS